MRASTHIANPFDMLVNPQAILDAIEHSAALEGLERKIWRPLERCAPVKPAQGAEAGAPGVTVDRSDDQSDF